LSKPIKFLKPFDASKISINKHPNFSDVYIVELPLDSVPNETWRDTFEQKWRSSRDLWDRKICLVNDKIKLLSAADYFDEKLDWIEMVVNDTNKAVKEHARIIAQEEELIRGETAKQLLRMEDSKTSMLDVILKKFA
jgi:hypothetical protein